MATSASQATQYGMDTNVVTKPPAPVAQPGQSQLEMMPRPEAPPGCPPGLEYLTQLDQIVLHHQWELGSSQHKYQIKNALGQQVYFASLNTNVLCQPFVTHIFDNTGQEVMSVVRQFQYCANYFWCDVFQLCAENCWCDDCCKYFALNVTVEAPPGQPIGHVRQRGSNWRPRVDFFDVNFEPLLKFRGPCCCRVFCCDCSVDLRLMSYDGSREVAKISREWEGCLNEFRHGVNDLNVTFPRDLDVKVKGTLLGSLF